MGRFVRIGLALAVALTTACATRSRAPDVPRVPDGAGLVLFYLEPLPREAAGLRAEIVSVAVRDADGAARLLTLESTRLDATGPARQRLLALGPLPAGAYGGIEVGLGQATLATEPDEASIPVTARPVSSPIPFRIEAGRATVIRLRLEPGTPIGLDQPFAPTFTGDRTTATDLTPAATAIASVPDLGAVVVFHKRSGEVFDLLLTGREPRGIAHDADRARAYVACAGSDTVEAYDLVRAVRDQALPLAPGDDPAGIALSRDGRTIVVANPGSNTVSILDAPSLAERFRVSVGVEPIAALLDADERRAFVFQRGGNGLAIVDLARGVVVGTIPTEPAPRFGALARAGRRLLVIHDQSSYLSVVDVTTLRVVDRAYVGPAAAAIAVDPRTDRVYVARLRSAAIEVYDPSALLPIETIGTASDVTFLAVDRETDQLLAAIPAERAIHALRLVGREVEAVVETAAGVEWIDLGAAGRSGP